LAEVHQEAAATVEVLAVEDSQAEALAEAGKNINRKKITDC
jgi:hypothetical protein